MNRREWVVTALLATLVAVMVVLCTLSVRKEMSVQERRRPPVTQTP